MTTATTLQVSTGFLALEAATENRRIACWQFQEVQEDQFERGSISCFVHSVLQHGQFIHNEINSWHFCQCTNQSLAQNPKKKYIILKIYVIIYERCYKIFIIDFVTLLQKEWGEASAA